MDKHLGVDLLEALRHHSGTVIGGDRIGEVFVEHRGLMAWAADEIAALRAALKLLESDRDAERNIRLHSESALAAMTAERDALKTELECAELRIKKLDRLMEFEEDQLHG